MLQSPELRKNRIPRNKVCGLCHQTGSKQVKLRMENKAKEPKKRAGPNVLCCGCLHTTSLCADQTYRLVKPTDKVLVLGSSLEPIVSALEYVTAVTWLKEDGSRCATRFRSLPLAFTDMFCTGFSRFTIGRFTVFLDSFAIWIVFDLFQTIS